MNIFPCNEVVFCDLIFPITIVQNSTVKNSLPNQALQSWGEISCVMDTEMPRAGAFKGEHAAQLLRVPQLLSPLPTYFRDSLCYKKPIPRATCV